MGPCRDLDEIRDQVGILQPGLMQALDFVLNSPRIQPEDLGYREAIVRSI